MKSNSETGIRETRGVWDPKTLVILAFFFTVIPSLIMFAINYGRYGFPRKRMLWIVLTIAAFLLVVAWDVFSPEWSWHRSFLLSVAAAWILYVKQIKLYRQWIGQGKKKASVWSGLLICFLFVAIVLGYTFGSFFIFPKDYVAHELILKRQFADAERVLLQSHKAYPDDLAVLFNLAVVYSETERSSMAKQVLQVILKRDPEFEDAQTFLSQLERQGDSGEHRSAESNSKGDGPKPAP